MDDKSSMLYMIQQNVEELYANDIELIWRKNLIWQQNYTDLCLPLWRNLIIYHKQQEVAVSFYYIIDYSTEGIFVIGQKWSEEYNKHPINKQFLQNFK